MRRYHIKIYLSDQNVIDAKSVAGSIEDAVDKIISSEQTVNFIGDNNVESIQLVDTEKVEPLSEERFLLQESTEPGYWVITDQQNGIVCKFLERQYNNNHKITDINDSPITDPLTLATALREMSEYLAARHPELIF